MVAFTEAVSRRDYFLFFFFFPGGVLKNVKMPAGARDEKNPVTTRLSVDIVQLETARRGTAHRVLFIGIPSYALITYYDSPGINFFFFVNQ